MPFVDLNYQYIIVVGKLNFSKPKKFQVKLFATSEVILEKNINGQLLL
jgi:hypothetical protein